MCLRTGLGGLEVRQDRSGSGLCRQVCCVLFAIRKNLVELVLRSTKLQSRRRLALSVKLSKKLIEEYTQIKIFQNYLF